MIVKNIKLKINELLSFDSKPFLQSTIYNPKSAFTIHRLRSGFTIVELLVVIVVIGILATITMVSYTGITQKATDVTIESDLSNSRKALQLYQVTYDSYPTTLDVNDCPATPTPENDPMFCLSSSGSNDYTAYRSDGTSYGLEITGANNTIYSTTDTTEPAPGALPPPPTLADTDPANWIAIGTQVWARYNLNVGTRIAGTVAQTNNGGANIEKYCYGDTEAGCTATDTNGIPYGALYQWGEAMGYAPAPTKPDEFVQGICPAGSHIPSDAEWKTLEMFLGMTQPQADATGGWRGTNQGTQLKPGGSSGMNVPLAGDRSTDGSFYYLSSGAYLWSSSESGGNAWVRYLYSGFATVYRDTYRKALGFSVRCIGN